MSGMKRIIAHWTVTKYDITAIAKKHYHEIVDGAGVVHKGVHPISANIRPQKGKYAAHTLNCNTGSIGISCAAMFGAKSVINYGDYPITEKQFRSMCNRIGELCVEYKIPVTPKTVLSHAEVQDNLGIKQRGKWDIAVLPFANLKTAKDCGNFMRRLVQDRVDDLTKPKLTPKPAPKPVAKTSDKALSKKTVVVGDTVVVTALVVVTFWDKISAWLGSFF